MGRGGGRQRHAGTGRDKRGGAHLFGNRRPGLPPVYSAGGEHAGAAWPAPAVCCCTCAVARPVGGRRPKQNGQVKSSRACPIAWGGDRGGDRGGNRGGDRGGDHRGHPSTRTPHPAAGLSAMLYHTDIMACLTLLTCNTAPMPSCPITVTVNSLAGARSARCYGALLGGTEMGTHACLQLSAFGLQLSTFSFQLSTFHCQLSATKKPPNRKTGQNIVHLSTGHLFRALHLSPPLLSRAPFHHSPVHHALHTVPPHQRTRSCSCNSSSTAAARVALF